ncbi:MAG: TMEM175 family protein [Chloroflexota bacterium]
MDKGRLEAFSDGVIAILITIMVLELRPPAEVSLAALAALAPVLFSYALSFVSIGIYWLNHHHLLAGSHVVTGGVLGWNLHLLFWLSMVPFGTAWIGENAFAPLAVAVYGFILLACGVSYFFLWRVLMRAQPPGAPLLVSEGDQRKGMLSVIGYTSGMVLALVVPMVSMGIYVLIAATWFIPDRRIEQATRAARTANDHGHHHTE